MFILSKLESGATPTARRPVDLADAAAATEAMRPSADGSRVTLTATCPPRLLVDGDADQLERALINLLSNAAKYTPAGGHAEVSAAVHDGKAVITVRDSGIGIPAADQQQAFTRFYRASNAVRDAIPGTGLGPAIVATTITRHGGEVSLQSQEGAGTTVTIRLPLPEPAHR